MRPALAALAEQQARLDRYEAALLAFADLAGAKDHVAALIRNPDEGIETTADVNNPTQPVPDAPAEAASETTEQARVPEASESSPAAAPGEVGGSTGDVPADLTTDVTDAGGVLPVDTKVDYDVQAPVAGTQDMDNGVGKQTPTRTEVDVRAAQPNYTPAYPLDGWTKGSSAERIFASQRLAQVRLAVGVAEGDMLALAQEINDSDLPDKAIEHETEVLGKVSTKRVAARTPRPTAPRLPLQSQPRLPSVEAAADDAGDLFD